MTLCDYNIERYIRKQYFRELNALSPVNRATEKFRLETEALQLDIRDTDELIGWFRFDRICPEQVVFDDEKQTPETEALIHAPERFSSRTNVDRGHTLIDYEHILRHGLVSYETKLDAERKKAPQDEYLSAMKQTLNAVLNLLKRVAGLIDEKIAECGESEKPRLLSLKRMIEKVPYRPADDFREAIQSIWIIHFLAPLAEDAWYSISLGKFDDYLYPYYEKSVQSGMTRAEAKRILHNLYDLLNHYADGACLLNVGPRYNELSELIIECQKDFSMPAPILGARVDDNTPETIWNMLIDEKLFSMGQPTFYGERSCFKALLEKGLSPEEASRFSNNSCMGIGIPGEEFDSMWGCVFSVSAVLEAAMNCGKLLHSDQPIVPSVPEPHTLDDLFENLKQCAGAMLEVCIRSYEKRAEISERTLPDPFLSLLTSGCIEKHCDRISGAKYHNVTFECMGLVNAADGICAIDELVFRSRKYTVSELNEAVKANFAGSDSLRNDILRCPKFGENSAADTYAVRMSELLQELIRGFDHDNLYHSPSLHTLDTNVAYGAAYGAGYDGRSAGAPFAKNAGASNAVRKSDPTSMILSSSGLPQTQFFGGQPIDVNFGADAVRNHKREIRALIMVYLERGGLQFQVNSLSSGRLRDAMEHPERYPDLVVRIGGYSIRFSQISKASQLEFIERFEKEEAKV